MTVDQIMHHCQLRKLETLPSGETVVVVRPMRFIPMTIPHFANGRRTRLNQNCLRAQP